MNKLFLSACLIGVVFSVLLTGCSGNKGSDAQQNAAIQQEVDLSVIYNNGTYEGKCSPDERGNYGIVTLEIKNDKIVNAVYKGYLKNGKPKDENYGKTKDKKTGKINEASYKKAQAVLVANAQYGPKLVEVQDINKVDVISGATHSHEQLIEAVKDALSKAKK